MNVWCKLRWTPSTPAWRPARSASGSYNRTGTLFEGRFKAIHVDREGYLLHLCRYIHANPVKDGLVARLEDWPYSNYHEWIGARHGSIVRCRRRHYRERAGGVAPAV